LAIEKIEKHHLALNRREVDGLTSAAADAKAQLQDIRGELATAENRATTLRSAIAGTERAATALNEGLRQYFGDDRLRITPQDGGFVITRSEGDGEKSIVDTLSEGERTALALVHFFTGLQGNLDISKPLSQGKRVFVIDDPVSSLDDNGLFRAEELVRRCAVDADQLFVLTHNFTFFRRIRRWLLNKKDSSVWSMYYLWTRYDAEGRTPCLQALPLLLRNYESDYHHLFSVVARAAGRVEPELDDEALPHVPNAARRVLETFVAFRSPNQSDIRAGLEKLVDSVAPSLSNTVGSMISFLHEGSHDQGVASEELSSGTDFLDRRRYQDVMELIEQTDKSHFDQMISACQKAAAQ
jgi:wobble nucleotide-excising tRNase